MTLPLEKQVCSLPLAKRLKELGVEQGSLAYWCNRGGEIKGHSYLLWLDEETTPGDGYINPQTQVLCSAFTVAEVLELLPHQFRDDRRTYYCGDHTCQVFDLQMDKQTNTKGYPEGTILDGWCIWYSNGEENILSAETFIYESLAESAAKMLIHLLEQGIINLKIKRV